MAQAAARREGLIFPGDPAVLAKLARHYRDPEVGQISVGEQGGQKWIKAGFVEGPIATRANPDGSVSIVSVGPGNSGVEALVGTADGKRTLTINHGQPHQYFSVEGQKEGDKCIIRSVAPTQTDKRGEGKNSD